MTALLSGCVRADAVAPPSGCTKPACSAGWTRSSGATAQHVWPVLSVTQNISLSFPNWVCVCCLTVGLLRDFCQSVFSHVLLNVKKCNFFNDLVRMVGRNFQPTWTEAPSQSP